MKAIAALTLNPAIDGAAAACPLAYPRISMRL